eukprot:TRINITY_DN2061_c0_g4_i1.p1 TRINITY_DN2061_c0_g4~~TRINITY_DN2061_c0_g4_i1.p1  ORF type:complete len:303 (-),score=42.28 TRINITY_DN2061_c0_g4_i1:186-1067(-)
MMRDKSDDFFSSVALLKHGFEAFAEGVRELHSHSSPIHKIILKPFIQLTVIIIIVTVVLVSVFLFPSRIVLTLLSFLTSAWWSERFIELRDRLTFFSTLWTLLDYIPYFYLLLVRYLDRAVLDNIFFRTLEVVEKRYSVKELSNIIRQAQLKTFNDWLWEYCQRVFKLIRLGLLLAFLGCLPIVGGFAVPLSHFYISYTVMGGPCAVFFTLVAYFTKSVFNINMPLWLTASNLSRDLLESYFGRMKNKKKEVYLRRSTFCCSSPSVFPSHSSSTRLSSVHLFYSTEKLSLPFC